MNASASRQALIPAVARASSMRRPRACLARRSRRSLSTSTTPVMITERRLGGQHVDGMGYKCASSSTRRVGPRLSVTARASLTDAPVIRPPPRHCTRGRSAAALANALVRQHDGLTLQSGRKRRPGAPRFGRLRVVPGSRRVRKRQLRRASSPARFRRSRSARRRIASGCHPACRRVARAAPVHARRRS